MYKEVLKDNGAGVNLHDYMYIILATLSIPEIIKSLLSVCHYKYIGQYIAYMYSTNLPGILRADILFKPLTYSYVNSVQPNTFIAIKSIYKYFDST